MKKIIVLNYSHHHIYGLLRSLQNKKSQKKSSLKRTKREKKENNKKKCGKRDLEKSKSKCLCCIKEIKERRKTKEKISSNQKES